jgi:hypothetical protein
MARRSTLKRIPKESCESRGKKIKVKLFILLLLVVVLQGGENSQSATILEASELVE